MFGRVVVVDGVSTVEGVVVGPFVVGVVSCGFDVAAKVGWEGELVVVVVGLELV